MNCIVSVLQSAQDNGAVDVDGYLRTINMDGRLRTIDVDGRLMTHDANLTRSDTSTSHGCWEPTAAAC